MTTSSLAIGIDIGGTKIAFALINREGDVFASHRIPTEVPAGPEDIVRRIVENVHALIAQAPQPIVGIGLGTAGMTDSKAGVVINAVNLGFDYLPLRQMVLDGMENRYPMWIDQDVHALAVGERYYGAGKDIDDFLMIAIGTGIGGAMFANGQIYNGATPFGMEIGHISLDPEGPLCMCGLHGCLEVYTSGIAIRREALAALEHDRSSSLRDLPREQIGAHSVAQAAVAGDALARRLYEDAGRKLGTMLAYYIGINKPSRIIISGSLAEVGELLLEPARQEIARRILAPIASYTEIVISPMGQKSPAVGAACLVWHGLHI